MQKEFFLNLYNTDGGKYLAKASQKGTIKKKFGSTERCEAAKMVKKSEQWIKMRKRGNNISQKVKQR